MEEKDELTVREKELLDSAYPHPAPDLADAVMGKIAAIRDARKKRTRLLIRYGSIAACVVIVAGVSLAVLPRMLSGNAGFLKDECASDLCEAEAVKNSCAPMEIYSLTAGDSDCDIPEEDADAQNKLYAADALDPETHSVSNGTGFAAVNDASEAPECCPNEAETENARSGPHDNPVIFALIDVDGDGVSEECTVLRDENNMIRITASQSGKTKYEGLFDIPLSSSISFEKNSEMLLRIYDSETKTAVYYRITVSNGEMILSATK